MEHVVHGFEAAGVVVLVTGTILAFASAAPAVFKGDVVEAYLRVRQMMGRAVLLGLEILIIADIVQTISIDPTLESAATLGLVVLVRTFLSFSLEIELDGIVPWQRWRLTDRSSRPDDDSSLRPAA